MINLIKRYTLWMTGIFLIGIVTTSAFVAFASTNWDKEWNDNMKQEEVLLKQLEAIRMERTAIEFNWCNDKLVNHYSGRTPLEKDVLKRCVAKTTDSSFR